MYLLLYCYQLLIAVICFISVMSLHCPFLSKKSPVCLLTLRTKSYRSSMFFALPPLQQWSSTMRPWRTSIKVRCSLVSYALEIAGLMIVTIDATWQWLELCNVACHTSAIFSWPFPVHDPQLSPWKFLCPALLCTSVHVASGTWTFCLLSLSVQVGLTVT